MVVPEIEATVPDAPGLPPPAFAPAPAPRPAFADEPDGAAGEALEDEPPQALRVSTAASPMIVTAIIRPPVHSRSGLKRVIIRCPFQRTLFLNREQCAVELFDRSCRHAHSLRSASMGESF